MTHGTFPRQPREGLPENLARVVERQRYFGVECRQTDGTFFEVAQFPGGASARAMRDRLNDLFAKPAADLQFIHITRRHDGYAVVWPTVKWVEDDSVTTTIGGCPAGTEYTSSERLYKASPLFVISTVTEDDVAWYGVPAWELAFLWANNVRYAVNGWNATKNSTPGGGLLFGGVVPVLPAPTDWDFGPVRKEATRYGYGECQPNFQTANGEIFHTMDLLVAVPGNATSSPRWARDQWVKVTYGRRSARARLVDVCGCNHLDLSRGLATYLRFPGSGVVTVSRP